MSESALDAFFSSGELAPSSLLLLLLLFFGDLFLRKTILNFLSILRPRKSNAFHYPCHPANYTKQRNFKLPLIKRDRRIRLEKECVDDHYLLLKDVEKHHLKKEADQ